MPQCRNANAGVLLFCNYKATLSAEIPSGSYKKRMNFLLRPNFLSESSYMHHRLRSAQICIVL